MQNTPVTVRSSLQSRLPFLIIAATVILLCPLGLLLEFVYGGVSFYELPPVSFFYFTPPFSPEHLNDFAGALLNTILLAAPSVFFLQYTVFGYKLRRGTWLLSASVLSLSLCSFAFAFQECFGLLYASLSYFPNTEYLTEFFTETSTWISALTALGALASVAAAGIGAFLLLKAPKLCKFGTPIFATISVILYVLTQWAQYVMFTYECIVRQYVVFSDMLSWWITPILPSVLFCAMLVIAFLSNRLPYTDYENEK